jgi:hypothetical protein
MITLSVENALADNGCDLDRRSLPIAPTRPRPLPTTLLLTPSLLLTRTEAAYPFLGQDPKMAPLSAFPLILHPSATVFEVEVEISSHVKALGRTAKAARPDNRPCLPYCFTNSDAHSVDWEVTCAHIRFWLL